MTNTPSPTDEDRKLIEALHGDVISAIYQAENEFACTDEDYREFAELRAKVEKAADRLESLLSDRAKLEGDWFDKAIRDHADEHGPSGGAWNISMVLDRLHRARAALNRSTDRAT